MKSPSWVYKNVKIAAFILAVKCLVIHKVYLQWVPSFHAFLWFIICGTVLINLRVPLKLLKQKIFCFVFVYVTYLLYILL